MTNYVPNKLFMNAMMTYSRFNEICSKAALKGIFNHLWYLAEKLVPLSLFSNAVEDDIKQRMAGAK